VLNRLHAPDWLRPFNFALLPLICTDISALPDGVNADEICALAPFTKNRNKLYDLPCVNVLDGRVFKMGTPHDSDHQKLYPYCLSGILAQYLRQPESKFKAPDGSRCDGNTRGLLQRTHVIAGKFRYIGKETSRRWAAGEDISMARGDLSPVDAISSREYNPVATYCDDELKAKVRNYPLARVACTAGLKRDTVYRFLADKPIHPHNRRRLESAIEKLEEEIRKIKTGLQP
jgi:hypothetical protein